MRSLPPPDRAEIRQHLTTAIEIYLKKDGGDGGYPATAAEVDAVIMLYDAYDAAFGVPNDALAGPALAAGYRQAVYDGYDFMQKGRKLNYVRTMLLRGVERCPICGISAPRELDHYLPRSVFKPLAVYVNNLVPICHECNSSKGAARQANPNQRFYHAYLEQLPPVRFMRAEVTLENGALLARIEIDPNAALPVVMRNRLIYQLERLKLNQRYDAEINIYLSGHTTAIHNAFVDGADGVRSFLLAQANVEFSRYHCNFWRPLVLVALADHVDFCDGGFQDVLPLNPMPIGSAEATYQNP